MRSAARPRPPLKSVLRLRSSLALALILTLQQIASANLPVSLSISSSSFQITDAGGLPRNADEIQQKWARQVKAPGKPTSRELEDLHDAVSARSTIGGMVAFSEYV